MDDAKVAKEGRKSKLKDVEAPLRERVQDKLIKKLEELGEGQRTVEVWNGANSRRSEWLQRQTQFQRIVDEFLEPLQEKGDDWSSNLHMPVVYTACKTMHARFMAALFGIDPPFVTKARKSANVDREPLVSDLMRYTLRSWSNYNLGVEPVVDEWLWDIVTSGSGVLKARWDRKYTRFVDVVEEQRLKNVFSVTNPETGELEQLPQYETVEVEREVTVPCFIGPVTEAVAPEDVVIVGGGGDPQLADEVVQQSWLTGGDLWTLADSKVFRRDSVTKVIESGENAKSGDMASGIKLLRADTSGGGSLDHGYDLQRYHILERYAKIDVDGSGIPADVVLWVHKETAEILRATYLYRINKSGRRPFFRSFFHRRRGDDNGVGLPELLYSLAMEVDALRNMRVDFGLVSSMPMGFIRATSSTAAEKMRFEPGALQPVDDPQRDIHFPQLGARWSFPAQEEQYTMQQIERMTSISDLNLGVMNGNQGAARTATGARALLGESNQNLSVYLKRINIGWRQFVQYMFEMVQDKIEPGFEFRLFGEDGDKYFRQIKSREEVAGQYDFEIEGNSENSNRSIQIEQASQIVATLMNPLLIQLQIVTPAEIYNALKNQFVTLGIRDFTKYLRQPQGALRIYRPVEILDAALAGVNIPLTPEQDLQGLLALIEEFLSDDQLNGQFGEQQFMALIQKQREAEAMLQALQAQQAQVANAQQVATNAALTAPTPQAAGAAQGQAMVSGSPNPGATEA